MADELRRIILVYLLCLVSLPLAVSETVVSSSGEPELDVVCTESGFAPTASFSHHQDKKYKFEVIVGDGRDGCKAEKDVTNIPVTQLIEVSDILNSETTETEIPYGTDGNYACGGTLENSDSNPNAENTIDYRVEISVIVTQFFRMKVNRKEKFLYSLRCFMSRDGTVTSQGSFTVASSANCADREYMNEDGECVESPRIFTTTVTFGGNMTDELTDPSSREFLAKAFEIETKVMAGLDNANIAAIKVTKFEAGSIVVTMFIMQKPGTPMNAVTSAGLEASFTKMADSDPDMLGFETNDPCTECPATARCVETNTTVACICPSGQYISEQEDGTKICKSTTKVVQVKGLTLAKPFKKEYEDLHSKASVELVNEIEPVLEKSLKEKMGASFDGVQITGFSSGSLKVDFAVYVHVDHAHDAPKVVEHLNAAIENNELDDIGVNVTASKIIAVERRCHDDHYLHKDVCVTIGDHTRATFSFTERVAWDERLLDTHSNFFETRASALGKKLDTDLQITYKEHIDANLLVLEFSEAANGYRKVSGAIVAVNKPLARDNITLLCTELSEFAYGEDYSFDSYDCCYDFDSRFGEAKFKGVYSYDTALAGETYVRNCTYNEERTFSRKCKSNPGWENVEEDGMAVCDHFKEKIQKLEVMSEMVICEEGTVKSNGTCQSVMEAAKNLSAIIAADDTIDTSHEIVYMSKVVGIITTRAEDVQGFNDSSELADNIVESVSHILDANITAIEQAETVSNAVTEMVVQLEKMGEKLMEAVTKVDEPIKAESPNIALMIVKVPEAVVVEVGEEPVWEDWGIQINTEAGSNLQISETSTNETSVANATTTEVAVEEPVAQQPAVVIPASTFKQYDEDHGFEGKVVAFVYRTAQIFQSNKTEQKVESVVISISLGSGTVIGDPAIRLNFEKNTTGDVVCSYWERGSGMSSGYWDQKGCSVEKHVGTTVTCACTHLTNFALLFSLAEAPVGPTHVILESLSVIGATLSLIGLVFTIIAHLVIRKLRRSLPSQILIFFSLSLIMLLVFFLAGMDRTSPKLGCQVFSGLIHYFMLATFAWTAVNAASLYQSIVMVFYDRNNCRFLTKSSILAWGIPAIIVVINGAVEPDSLAPTDKKQFCFLHGNSLYFAVILPVVLVIVSNVVVFACIMFKLCRKTMVRADETRDLTRQFRVAVGCIVLLGLTWLFGLFAIGKATFTFQILFCIFNAFQGLYVFILYTLRNPTVRKELCGCEDERSGSSSGYTYRTTTFGTRNMGSDAAAEAKVPGADKPVFTVASTSSVGESSKKPSPSKEDAIVPQEIFMDLTRPDIDVPRPGMDVPRPAMDVPRPAMGTRYEVSSSTGKEADVGKVQPPSQWQTFQKDDTSSLITTDNAGTTLKAPHISVRTSRL